jgi:hypothetical protein
VARVVARLSRASRDTHTRAEAEPKRKVVHAMKFLIDDLPVRFDF